MRKIDSFSMKHIVYFIDYGFPSRFLANCEIWLIKAPAAGFSEKSDTLFLL